MALLTRGSEPHIELLPRSGGLGVSCGGVRRPSGRDPPTSLSGELDYLPTSRVSLEELRVLAAELGASAAALDVLSEDEKPGLPSGLREETVPPHTRKRKGHNKLSRMSESNVKLLRASVMEDVEMGTIGAINCPIFTVAKKNKKLRLIMDCRPTNRRHPKPPKMEIPSLHDFITHVMENEIAGSCDAKCFFYQVPIPHRLRSCFTTKIKHARGGHKRLQMTTLPMGWSWAPYCAQGVSNIVMHQIGLAWIDNYVVGGKSLDEFNRKKAILQERLKRVNLEVDNPDFAPATVLKVLGLEMDLKTKMYRLDNPVPLKPNTCKTAFDHFELIGHLLWSGYAKRMPLCNYPHTLGVLRRVGQKIASGQLNWEDPVPLYPQETEEIGAWIQYYNKNEWCSQKTCAEPNCEVWSDASDTLGAFLIFTQDKLVAAEMHNLDPLQHIFLKEMAMGTKGILRAHEMGLIPRLITDSKPAQLAMRRRLSSNLKANYMLQKIGGEDYVVDWISTEDQLSDGLTRGLGLPSLGLSKASVEAIHAHFKSGTRERARKKKTLLVN